MIKTKKNPIVGLTKNMMVGGMGLMLGSAVVGKVAHMNPSASMTQIESGVQSGFQIGSAVMPVMGAGMVMQSMDQLVGTKKKNKYL